MNRWEGKKVAVVGLGISNLAVIDYLLPRKAQITACDRKSAEELGERYEVLKDKPIKFSLGESYLEGLSEFDVVFLAPGLPKELPEIKALANSPVKITSEMELFLSLNPARTVGVTGSSGKTTTTTLIGKMLGVEHPVHVGGNIGTPLLGKIGDITRDDWVVLELSSFQLEILHQSPNIAVVTNITPNHLDVHPSMEAYIAAKKRIFQFQSSHDTLIVNYDDPTTRAFAEEAKGKVYFFSRQTELEQGAFVRDRQIVIRNVPPIANMAERTLCSVDELRLIGTHNIENALAAALAAGIAGASPEALVSVLTTFTGVAHRLELVREIDGVRFYNDSIATTPARAIAGINAFAEPIVLIAGGYDKNLPFDEFAEVVVKKTKAVVLMGSSAQKIEQAIREKEKLLGQKIQLVRAKSFDEAVTVAGELASPGDVVLMSPACASYDMFRNFEERGNRFRELVASLIKRIAK